MQPIKITIQGDYFDCQIYRGRLYLWTFDGDLKVYKWDELVETLNIDESDRMVFNFAFLDGNELYNRTLVNIFQDSEFKQLLQNKFERLANIDFEISLKDLDELLFGIQETPTGLIPTDTEMYGNKLYFITDNGFFSCTSHRPKKVKYPLSSKVNKLWDCKLLSIKANKYPQIALSAGDDGLFELNLAHSKPDNLSSIETESSIFHISDKHSSFSNYAYLSIYNTSLSQKSFIALFKWIENANPSSIKNTFLRNFDTMYSEDELFEDENNQNLISWGIDDKIYKATNNGFEVIRFNNYANPEKGEKIFTKLKKIEFQAWKGQIINGGSTFFGNIIECENALVIIQSDNSIYTISGPITRWRVYPRSINYENHLHVILDDRIEIYSFNNDYFTNQITKNIGIQHKNQRAYKKRSFTQNTNKYMSFDADEELPF